MFFHKNLRVLFIITALFSIFFFASCSKKVKYDEKVITGILENGLTYIIRQNSKPANKASLRLAIRSGSIQEDEDQKGIAHLVEHMAFNGIPSFPKNELRAYLEQLGIQFGSDLNAYTSYDRTVYKLEVPLKEPNSLETAFTVLKEWSTDIIFDGEEIDKERGVVLQEWRDGLGASNRLRDKYLPLIFKNSIYAVRKTIGDPDIIRNSSHKRIRDFYNKWYSPERMAIIAVGDFDAKEIEKLIIDKFSPIKGENPIDIDNTIYDSEGTDFGILFDSEADSSSIWIVNRLPNLQKDEFQSFRDELLLSVADKIITNRFGETLNDNVNEIIGAYSNILSFVIARKFFLTGIDFKTDDSKEAITKYYQQLELLRQKGINQNELNQAISEIKVQLKSISEEQDSLESIQKASMYVESFLNNEKQLSPNWMKKKGTQIVENFRIEEIENQLKTLLLNKNRAVIIIAPENEKDSLPKEEALKDLFLSIEKTTAELENLTNESKSPKNLIYEPKGKGNIISKSYIKELDCDKWILSNKAVVYLKETKFTKNRFQFIASSEGGTSLIKDTLFGSAELADDLVSNSGLSNLTKVEKNRWKKRNSIGASLSIDELNESISGGGDSDNIEDAIMLLAALFNKVKSDKESFEQVQSEIIEIARNREKDPQSYFGRQLNQILRNKGDRNPELSVEVAKTAKFKSSVKIYKERFADASDFTFIISGSFNKNRLEKAIKKYIATLPSDNNRENRETFNQTYSKYPLTSSTNEIKRGVDDKALIYTLFHGELKWDPLFYLKMKAAASCLDIMLDKKIREDESGTYSISAFTILRQKPYEEFISGIVFSCIPNRRIELEKLQDKIISDFLQGNFENQLLDNFKKIQLSHIEEQKESDEYWISIINSISSGYTTLEDLMLQEERIKALSKKDVINAGKAIFSNQTKTKVILLPQ